MNTIYCIEDCDGLKYIGVTRLPLYERLKNHRYIHNNQGKYGSNGSKASQKLNMNDCKIYEIDKCEDCDRKEKERYYIENTECVNKHNNNQDLEEYKKNMKEKIENAEDEIQKKKLKKQLYNKTYYVKYDKDKRSERSIKHYNNNKEYISGLAKFRYYARQNRLNDLLERYPDIYTEFIHLKEKYM